MSSWKAGDYLKTQVSSEIVKMIIKNIQVCLFSYKWIYKEEVCWQFI